MGRPGDRRAGGRLHASPMLSSAEFKYRARCASVPWWRGRSRRAPSSPRTSSHTAAATWACTRKRSSSSMATCSFCGRRAGEHGDRVADPRQAALICDGFDAHRDFHIGEKQGGRLPGKTLHRIQGRSVIEHIIDRARMVPDIDAVVLTTSVHPDDASARRGGQPKRDCRLPGQRGR